MRPAIVVVLVSVGLMTPVTGTFAQPRSAQGACSPNRPSDFPLNRWAGWNVDGRGQTIGGVYARIFNYVPYVDPVSQGDFVYTWTMLTVDHPLGADAPYVVVPVLAAFHREVAIQTRQFNLCITIQNLAKLCVSPLQVPLERLINKPCR